MSLPRPGHVALHGGDRGLPRVVGQRPRRERRAPPRPQARPTTADGGAAAARRRVRATHQRGPAGTRAAPASRLDAVDADVGQRGASGVSTTPNAEPAPRHPAERPRCCAWTPSPPRRRPARAARRAAGAAPRRAAPEERRRRAPRCRPARATRRRRSTGSSSRCAGSRSPTPKARPTRNPAPGAHVARAPARSRPGTAASGRRSATGSKASDEQPRRRASGERGSGAARAERYRCLPATVPVDVRVPAAGRTRAPFGRPRARPAAATGSLSRGPGVLPCPLSRCGPTSANRRRVEGAGATPSDPATRTSVRRPRPA